MASAKYEKVKQEIFQLHEDNLSNGEIAKHLSIKYGEKYERSGVQKFLKREYPNYNPRSSFGANWSQSRQMRKQNPQNAIEQQMLESGLVQDYGSNWKHAWLKDKNGASIFVRNTSEIIPFDQMRADFIDEMKQYSPIYPTIERQEIKEKHLLVIDPSDIHVNKLATQEETNGIYNSEIAVKRVKEAIESILQKSSGFPLDKIVLVIGNDVLNTDNTSNSTTKGTPQDVSNRWYEGFRMAKQMYIDAIELLLTRANVEVIHVMSNHDYTSGFMLADSVYSWFRNCENVSFNLEVKHRKYFKWGSNLIGLSHGDKFKSMDAPLLMANEAPQLWAGTYYRYFYLHHIHHHTKTKFQSGKDYQGVTVQHLRSPSPADLWHFDSGYTHAKQAIEAFIHHETQGQVCCITHNF